MGWVDSPPFFYAASETARDIAQDYCEMKIGTLTPHKFTSYVIGNQAYEDLPERDKLVRIFHYLLEVYVDDFARTKGWETCWSRWAAYVAPMGVDPFL